MSECMLKLENIVAGYGYGPDIIKNINLELNKGDIKCIIGPNGAGKSTVLKSYCWNNYTKEWNSIIQF